MIDADSSARTPRLRARFALALGALLAAAPASAIELADGHLNLSGFGGWQMGVTNANVYLAGTPGSNFTTAYAGLNVNGAVDAHLRGVVQISFRENVDGPHFSFDYGFAEYAVSDAFKVRAGQVKQPFGLSTETFNIGTLRPFLDLPQALYGPVGFVGLAYKGAGITGEVPLGNAGWRLGYDVYGGGLDLVEFVAPEQYLRGEAVTVSTEQYRESTRGVLGVRANVQTPIEGLRFGVSAYQGWEIGSGWRFTAAGHIEYVNDFLEARFEYVHETILGDLWQNGGYLEAAWKPWRGLQIAAQAGRLEVHYPEALLPSVPSFTTHREFVLGVNYWISPALVVKVEVRRVWGNRLAGPDPQTYASTVALGQIATVTNLLQAGVQFAF